MTEIISKTVSAAGCRVHCLQTKQAQGRDILLLHGAKFEAATWKELTTLDRLGDAGYTPHAIDLPGFGESPACTATQETVLQEFIRQEKLSRPVLVGPSMSGRITLDFVIKQPGSVGGLVLIGAVGVRERIEQLDAIQVPCLIAWGSRDPVSPLDDARLLHKKISGAELRIFENAGHPCYLDAPDLWHQALLEFLHKTFSPPRVKTTD